MYKETTELLWATTTLPLVTLEIKTGEDFYFTLQPY